MILERLENVRVVHGGKATLDVPAFELEEGEIRVVVGPTGAGKSTLLRVLHLLERPTEGRALWRGEPTPWPAPLALRRRIAMAFQEPLPLAGTVFDNVAYGLKLRGFKGAELRARVGGTLALLRIDHLAARSARTLSGGEAQRTALARALALRPELLLLDEPLAALDEPIREALREELRTIVRENGITCVYVTHDQTEAFTLGDRLTVVHAGRIAQTGPPAEVFRRPKTRFVAQFVQAGNILPCEVLEATSGRAVVSLGQGRLVVTDCDVEAGARRLCCVRAEDVALVPAEAAGDASGGFVGEVAAATELGALTRVALDCGFPLVALLPRRAAEEMGLAVGRRLVARIAPETAHLIEDGDDSAHADDGRSSSSGA